MKTKNKRKGCDYMYGVFKMVDGIYRRVDYAKRKQQAIELRNQYRNDNPEEDYVAEKLTW